MRDFKKIAFDLRVFFQTAQREIKERIANEALEESQERAPKDTGFLSGQGYAFINGEPYDTTEGESAAPRRVSIPPKGGYTDDVTIVYRAGRPTKSGDHFDYAYYVGKKDPDWLRFASTMHWIEMSLNPEKAIDVIHRVFMEKLS